MPSKFMYYLLLSTLRLDVRNNNSSYYLGHIYYMSGTIPCFITVNSFKTETPMKYILLPSLSDEEIEAQSYLPEVNKTSEKNRDSDPDICSDLVRDLHVRFVSL